MLPKGFPMTCIYMYIFKYLYTYKYIYAHKPQTFLFIKTILRKTISLILVKKYKARIFLFVFDFCKIMVELKSSWLGIPSITAVSNVETKTILAPFNLQLKVYVLFLIQINTDMLQIFQQFNRQTVVLIYYAINTKKKVAHLLQREMPLCKEAQLHSWELEL